MSFDATQTLAKILTNLSVPPTRQAVLDVFKTIHLSSDETSGDELRFCTNSNLNCVNGNSNRESRLVQVVKYEENAWQFQAFPLSTEENLKKLQ